MFFRLLYLLNRTSLRHLSLSTRAPNLSIPLCIQKFSRKTMFLRASSKHLNILKSGEGIMKCNVVSLLSASNHGFASEPKCLSDLRNQIPHNGSQPQFLLLVSKPTGAVWYFCEFYTYNSTILDRSSNDFPMVPVLPAQKIIPRLHVWLLQISILECPSQRCMTPALATQNRDSAAHVSSGRSAFFITLS